MDYEETKRIAFEVLSELLKEIEENVKKGGRKKRGRREGDSVWKKSIVERVKRSVAKKYRVKRMLTNIELLSFLEEFCEEFKVGSGEKRVIKDLLLTKPSRSLSGVAPVAIMSYPFPCPHGKCYYCPGGPESYFGTTPQSYTGKEPAARRALRANYDPYLQVFNRLEQYFVMGHWPEKTELIIMGGTFPSFKIKYQDYFITYALKAMNDFSMLFYKGESHSKGHNKSFDFKRFKDFFMLPAVFSSERTRMIQEKLLRLKYNHLTTLKNEQLRNERSMIRNVALCIETRPDFSNKEHINQMLKLGTTRVEIGVQSLYDEVLKKVNRGHSVKDVIKATQLLKDSFLKVGYHMMPGLPCSSKERDVEMFKELFDNPDFRPDALKIYPLMVFKGTRVYDWWKQGKYKPITTREAIDVIIRAKRFVPKYCRIMRVQRDIPTKYSEAGVDITNLRQKVHEEMKKRGLKCRCIRCREPRNKKVDFDSVKLLRFDYEASSGLEVFLSFEDVKNDLLLGFLRLRIPYKPFRPEIDSKTVGIRELHVYGRATPLSTEKETVREGVIQHQGFGRKLLLEAERITREDFNKKKILIISGIGVRPYYRRFGYRRKGPYMMKVL